MIFIPPNKTGAIWLRAMFRFYCEKFNCAPVWMPDGTAKAYGREDDCKAAEHAYEMAEGKLLIAIVDAIATQPERNQKSVAAEVTKNFVKQLYKERVAANV